MTTPYQAIPVGDRIHGVGAIDWSIRDFHGYCFNHYKQILRRTTSRRIRCRLTFNYR